MHVLFDCAKSKGFVFIGPKWACKMIHTELTKRRNHTYDYDTILAYRRM